VRTFDEAVGGVETPRNRLDAATDEGHVETVVVAHEHRRALAAAVDADVTRLSADVDCHRHGVDARTALTANRQQQAL